MVSGTPRRVTVEHWKFLVGELIFFNGKYETKLEFPEGWGLKPENSFVGGVWMFSGTKILDNVMTKRVSKFT